MVGAMDSPRRRLRLGLVWLRRRLARWRWQPEHPMPPPRPADEANSPLAPVYPFNELRLQMMLGISAMNDLGFVEPRVMMGAAGA